jgi:hypothetical protein
MTQGESWSPRERPFPKKVLKNVALSANSDFFGNTSWRSETAANSMSEPEGRVLNLQ